MMADKEKPKSYEERIASCPIHQWADVDDYLTRTLVPQTSLEAIS